MRNLTIGELARSADVPTSTVRYYERSGLLKPDQRTGGNYRQYHPRTLERLRFIRSAQGIGLSLNEVSELLELTSSDADPCPDVEDVLKRRIAEVRGKVRDLRRIEKTLTAALNTCCIGGRRGICEAVVQLKQK